MYDDIFVGFQTKLGVSSQMFIKIPNIKFNRSPAGRTLIHAYREADRWTDRHDEANRRF